MKEPVLKSVEEVLPPSRRTSLLRFAKRLSSAQFSRYLVVGGWNTCFGFSTSVFFIWLFTKYSPHGYIFAGIPATFINITVSFLGYKYFVFKTKGNFVQEWLRCFAVYGSGAIPGFFLLPILKNAIVYATLTHPHTYTVHGHTMTLQQLAPYLAQAILNVGTVIYSFFGNKKFTFRAAKPAATGGAA